MGMGLTPTMFAFYIGRTANGMEDCLERGKSEGRKTLASLLGRGPELN